jgi:hypothetical protein
VHSISARPEGRRSATAAALTTLAPALRPAAVVDPAALLADLLRRLLPGVPGARAVRLTVCCSGARPEVVAVPDGTGEAAGPIALDTALEPGADAGRLTFYADAPFPPDAAEGAAEVAAVCAVAVAAIRERVRADNLEKALGSSRQIAAAVGIVMAQRRCTYDEAFRQIKAASQHGHRKMRDLAEDIVLTGELPDGPGPDGTHEAGRRLRVEPGSGSGGAEPEPAPPRRAG